MKKIAIFGAFCQNNFGDDLFFYTLNNLFSRYKRKINLIILTPNPNMTYEDSVISVKYVYSRGVINVAKEVAKCEIVVFGPGNIYGNQKKDIKTNLFIFILSILSKLLNKKIIDLSIDVSAMQPNILKIFTVLSFCLHDKIYFRFGEDYKYFKKSLPCIKTKIERMSDLVYSEYFLDTFRKKEEILQEKQTIGVVFSDLKHLPNYEFIEDFLINFIKLLMRLDVHKKIYILNKGKNDKDFKYLKYLDQKYNLKILERKDFSIINVQRFDKKNILKVIRNFEEDKVIVSGKLHSTIVGTLLKKKIISMSYHDKMRKLNKEIGLSKKYDVSLDYLNGEEKIIKEIRRLKKVLEELLRVKKVNYDFKRIEDLIQLNTVQLKKISKELLK